MISQTKQRSLLYKLAKKHNINVPWSAIRKQTNFNNNKKTITEAIKLKNSLFEFNVPYNKKRRGRFYIKDAIKNIAKNNIIVSLYEDDNLIKSKQYLNIDLNNLNEWWENKAGLDWNINSEYDIIATLRGQVKIMISGTEDITPTEFNQYFLDGNTHCFFNPIIEWCNLNANEEKRKTVLNKIMGRNGKEGYLKQYKNGITKEQIQEVANDLNMQFYISDFLGNEWLNIKPNKEQKVRKVFKFQNVRENHLEIQCDTIKTIEINENEMAIKADELIKNSKTFKYAGKEKTPTTLYIDDICYKLNNELHNIYNKFEEETGINKYCKVQLDTEQEKNIYMGFVKQSVHIGACVDYVECPKRFKNDPLFRHIDHIKSYSQHKSCDYYMGFCPKITDYRKVPANINNKEFLLKHLGFFEIENIDLSNCSYNVCNHLLNLNIFKLNDYFFHDNYVNTTKYIFTTPELLFYIDLGVNFDIKNGAWGCSSFDFDYTDEMLKKYNGTPIYSTWAGTKGRIKEEDELCIYATDDLLKDLKGKYNNLTFYNKENLNMGQIRTPKQHIKTMIHLFSYITSYSRISTLQQLFKIDYKQVLRVNMDGIYYLHNDNKQFTLNDNFISKIDYDKDGTTKFPNNEPSDKYISYYDIEYKEPVAEYEQNFKNALMTGQGGAGKTHHNLINVGYVNIHYTTISWKLVAEKINEYKVNGSVLYNFIVEEGTGMYKGKENIHYKILQRKQPAVILLDEATMITDKQKDKLIQLFPYSKIIFCGDFNANNKKPYQLEPHTDCSMSFENIDYIKEFKTNYRTNDNDLKKLLYNVRSMMDKRHNLSIEDIQNGNIPSIKNYIYKYFEEKGQIVNKEQVLKDYNINDYILCSRRSCKECNLHTCNHTNNDNFVQEWTDAFKGKFDKEKYLITTNSNGNCNGDVIITNEKPKDKHEIRHAFTIHAIQGLTIKNSKIFIDSRRLFDNNMLYVALSRATKLKQLYFIK